jgi:hypothetical protein
MHSFLCSPDINDIRIPRYLRPYIFKMRSAGTRTVSLIVSLPDSDVLNISRNL